MTLTTTAPPVTVKVIANSNVGRKHEWARDVRYAELRTFRYKAELGKPCDTPRAGIAQRVRQKVLSFADRVMDMIGVKGFRAEARTREAHFHLAQGIDQFSRAVCARDYENLPGAFTRLATGLRLMHERGLGPSEIGKAIAELTEFQMVPSPDVPDYADINQPLLATLKAAVVASDDASFDKAVRSLCGGQENEAITDAMNSIRAQVLAMRCSEPTGEGGDSNLDPLASGALSLLNAVGKIRERDLDARKRLDDVRVASEARAMEPLEPQQTEDDPTRTKEFIQRFGQAAFEEHASVPGAAKRYLDALDEAPNTALEAFFRSTPESPAIIAERERDLNNQISEALGNAWMDGAKKHEDRLDRHVSRRDRVASSQRRSIDKQIVDQARATVASRAERARRELIRPTLIKSYVEHLYDAIQFQVAVDDARKLVEQTQRANKGGSVWSRKKPDAAASLELGKQLDEANARVKSLSLSAGKIVTDRSENTELHFEMLALINRRSPYQIAVSSKGEILFTKGDQQIGVNSLSVVELRDVLLAVRDVSAEAGVDIFRIGKEYRTGVSIEQQEREEVQRIRTASDSLILERREQADKLKAELLDVRKTAIALLRGPDNKSPHVFGFTMLVDDLADGNVLLDASTRIEICRQAGVNHVTDDDGIVWFDRLSGEETRRVRDNLIFRIEEAIVRLSDPIVSKETLTAVRDAMKKQWVDPVAYDTRASAARQTSVSRQPVMSPIAVEVHG
ncbi:hypothetical protein FP568_04285 [Pandoraea pnomenusa]|uniref:hypothetical protein n=1 Tax=Pandoraea pnomenusa TaxID=93220 RepID=UPI00119839FE|nr:hypothetical protein [Pandoraea pnomenusa]QDX20547.1 hypothetical protein FP568_04285 [Pandoraea pnomenusa]